MEPDALDRHQNRRKSENMDHNANHLNVKLETNSPFDALDEVFSRRLIARLAAKHLLKHPFYQAWNDGTLPLEKIRHYAVQYYHHVRAFPRYVSATHANCDVISTRQVLLENLIDEERGEDNHPELWLRFAEGLGEERSAVTHVKPTTETKALVDAFMRYANESYEGGIGALFAYEHQIPEIAQFKIRALREKYGITDERTLLFFTVHSQADIYHTQALAGLLDQMTAPQQKQVEAVALFAADLLWKFLDGVNRMERSAA